VITDHERLTGPAPKLLEALAADGGGSEVRAAMVRNTRLERERTSAAVPAGAARCRSGRGAGRRRCRAGDEQDEAACE
jgi:hypothetical protein